MQRTSLARAVLIAVLLPAAASAAPILDVLYSFKGGKDGALPLPGSGSTLIADSSGVLYGGTAGLDSSTDFGTIFKLSPPAAGKKKWVETVLYRFKGGADGWYPGATLLPDGAGGFYGTAFAGGTGSCTTFSPLTGCGVVFQIKPPKSGNGAWSEKVLYSFTGGNDGANPTGPLIADSSGALYSMTAAGGDGPCTSPVAGCGTVYKLTPPGSGGSAWTEALIYVFQGGNDGATPQAGLTADAKGNLYGATAYGGSANYGLVFKLVPPKSGTAWKETPLYTFQGGADGGSPQPPPIFGAGGTLLGTTYFGGASGLGAVYQLTPPAKGSTAWTETTLHSFQGGSDGSYANNSLSPVTGGSYVTTTDFGGTGACSVGGTAGCGTVVQLTPPAKGSTDWSESVLYSFQGGPDGGLVGGGLLVDSSGAIYGAAQEGGIAADCPGFAVPGCGTVFRLK